MKLRKITALFTAIALTASTAIVSFAATEIAKEGTTIVLADTADGARADDTSAELNISWEEGKIILNVAVTDSNIDNTNANLWERDSVELRVNSMSEIRINGATGEISGGAADLYDVVWVLTDKGYDVTATYANADIKAGYKFTLAAQVNACTNGKRDCTIQLDAAQANAWQDDTVRTPMVLSGGADNTAEETEETDETAEEEEEESESESAEEDAPVVNVIPMVNGEAVLFEGSESCSNWGQAVKVPSINNDGDVFDYAMLQPGSTIVVTYSGTTPEVILQSWSGGNGWAKVAAFEDNGSEAIFTYDDMVASFGDDLTLLDQLNVGDTGGDLTVTKVVLKSKAAADEETVATQTAVAAAGTDAAANDTNTAAAGNTNVAASAAKGSADTGIEGAAIVAALAVIGAGAVIISRKRK